MRNNRSLLVLGILFWAVIGVIAFFEFTGEKAETGNGEKTSDALREISSAFERYRAMGYTEAGPSFPNGCGEPSTNSGKYCGLYYELSNQGNMVALISASLAAADCRADGNTGGDVGNGFYIPVINVTGFRYLDPVIFNMHPKEGYWFALLRNYGTASSYDGEYARYHYGMVAFPSMYGKTGETMFIINEEGTVYSKDNGNSGYIDTFPSDPEKEGWVSSEAQP